MLVKGHFPLPLEVFLQPGAEKVRKRLANVLQLLALFAPQQCAAQCARLVCQYGEKPGVQTGCQQGGLCQPGVSGHGNASGVDLGQGAQVIQHPHGGPCPQNQLAGRVGGRTVNAQHSGKAVVKVGIVGRHIPIAEGGYCIAPVCQLLRGQIFVGHIGTEVDEHDGRAGLFAAGDDQRHREGKLAARQSHGKAQLLEGGLSGTEPLVHRHFVDRKVDGGRRQLTVGLLTQQLLQLHMALPPAGGGGRESDIGQRPAVQHFLQSHSNTSQRVIGQSRIAGPFSEPR